MTLPIKIIPSLLHIADRFNGLLLDAYGVFWGGNDYGLFPHVKEMMETLVLNGKIVGILSNSTQLVSKEINKLHFHGLIQGKHFHFLITSGEVTRDIFLNDKLPFETPKHKFWIFGEVHPKFSSHEAIFKDTIYHETLDINEADFIYVSIPNLKGEDQIDPELFRKELESIISRKLPMICPNPDQFAHEGKPPRSVVRQGSIAKIYEEMGGQVFYIGKPNKNVFSIAMDYFNQYRIFNPLEILMVGDTPETDIRGARLFGMHSALVTQTGIMADRISRNGLEKSLKELPVDDTPIYYIERFGNGIRSSH